MRDHYNRLVLAADDPLYAYRVDHCNCCRWDTPIMSRLIQAIDFAKDVHVGQVDKGGLPYIIHPIMVRISLKDESEDIQIIAILHDVMEDGGVTEAQLTTLFGEHVGMSVNHLTRRKDEESYGCYIARIAFYPDVVKVKIADLKDNLDMRRRENISESLVERYTEALTYLEGLKQ